MWRLCKNRLEKKLSALSRVSNLRDSLSGSLLSVGRACARFAFGLGCEDWLGGILVQGRLEEGLRVMLSLLVE